MTHASAARDIRCIASGASSNCINHYPVIARGQAQSLQNFAPLFASSRSLLLSIRKRFNLTLIKLPNHIQAKCALSFTNRAFLTKVWIANKGTLMATLQWQSNFTKPISSSALRTELRRPHLTDVVAGVTSASVSPVFIEVLEDTVHSGAFPCFEQPDQPVPPGAERPFIVKSRESI